MSIDGDICGLCGSAVLDIDQKCPRCGADLASTAARRLIGKVLLSDYEVIDILGQGGMAVVYRGRHRVTGQEAALKVLPPELAARKDVQSRFVEEARALAQLDHPNIVHLYNFDSDEGCFILAMQLAEGPTWERMILEGDIEWRQSVDIAIQVCSALEYAHERGIVHRDMKPSNVIIRKSDGAAMLTDFGIAKGASDSKLTATGQTMGTVRYMSPEQVRGREVGKRSDIYSLAVTLYESIAGETPFGGETHFEIMSQHLKAVAEPLSDVVDDIPPALSEAVAWGMAKRTDERPESAAVFAHVLSQIAAGHSPAIPRARAAANPAITEPSSPSIAVAAGPTRSRVLLFVGIAVALLAVAGAAVLFTMRGGEPSATKPTVDAGSRAATRPLPKAEKPVLPSGVVLTAQQVFSKDNLRMMVAPELEPGPYLEAYRVGVEKWRRFLATRGLTADPEFRRPMPEALIIVAPADLLCNRTSFAKASEWRECLEVGTFQSRARALLVPDPVDSIPRAIESFVSLLYCEASASKKCFEAATAFQREIFSK